VVFGEVGLAGEVRAITQPEPRISEAAKLGFLQCMLPSGNVRRLAPGIMELHGVATVQEALQLLL
jgi:DNA repair protein RadA/Sms